MKTTDPKNTSGSLDREAGSADVTPEIETPTSDDEPTLTPKELEALFTSAPPEQRMEETPPSVPPIAPPSTSRRRRWMVALIRLFGIGVGVTFYLYIQNKPKPVPSPSSVNLTPTANETTNQMPETAFKISPEKQ